MAITKTSWSTVDDEGSTVATVLPYINHVVLQQLKKESFKDLKSLEYLHFHGLKSITPRVNTFLNDCRLANFPGFARHQWCRPAERVGQLNNLQHLRSLTIAEMRCGDFSFKLRADGTILVPTRNSTIYFSILQSDSKLHVKCSPKYVEKLDKLYYDGALNKSQVNSILLSLSRVYKFYSQICSLVIDPEQGGIRILT